MSIGNVRPVCNGAPNEANRSPHRGTDNAWRSTTGVPLCFATITEYEKHEWKAKQPNETRGGRWRLPVPCRIGRRPVQNVPFGSVHVIFLMKRQKGATSSAGFGHWYRSPSPIVIAIPSARQPRGGQPRLYQNNDGHQISIRKRQEFRCVQMGLDRDLSALPPCSVGGRETSDNTPQW